MEIQKREIVDYKVTWNYPVIRNGKIQYTTCKSYVFKYAIVAKPVAALLKAVAAVKGKYYSVWFATRWTPIDLDYSQIEVLKVGGIRGSDAHDFCDAYIESANYGDREMTEEELDALNDNSDYVYAAVEKYIY